jgi:hypothetical protein
MTKRWLWQSTSYDVITIVMECERGEQSWQASIETTPDTKEDDIQAYEQAEGCRVAFVYELG